jgi:hypothetical protein
MSRIFFVINAFAVTLSMAWPCFSATPSESDEGPVLSGSVHRNPAEIGALGLKYASQHVWLFPKMPLIVGVVGVSKGGPAHLAGIRTGDQIVAINGTPLESLTPIAVQKLMEGDPGTVANLTIKRRGAESTVTVLRVSLDTLPDPTFRETFLTQRTNNTLKLAYYYFRQGNFEDAAKSYRKILETAPEGSDKQSMINAVTALEDEIDHWSTVKCNPRADNYLDECAQNGYSRWPASSMPLKVFIADGTGLQNFHPIMTHMLRRSFDEWSAATKGRVRFEFVNDAKTSNIECLWTNDRRALSNTLEGGDTRVLGDRHNITHATIQIMLTTESGERISASQAKAVTLHEIGHALGLIGHTRNGADIMFPAATNIALSLRDKKTIADLYSLDETSVAAKPQKRLR